MAITKPELPPRAGYVEIEVDGVRKYRSASTGYILGEEPPPEPSELDLLRAQVEEQQKIIDALMGGETNG